MMIMNNLQFLMLSKSVIEMHRTTTDDRKNGNDPLRD